MTALTSKPSGLEARVVDSRRRQADFFQVRRDLYRHDPAAVLPLRSMEWKQLDATRHPFYQHARRQVWVVYRRAQPVGRIAAIVDDLHNAHYRERMGFFGFFESPNDREISRLLLATAEEWLRSEGCEAMRGPVNPSMKSEFGVLLEGNDQPPFIMMSHTPRYYHELLGAYGLQPARKFMAFLFEPAVDTEAFERFDRLGVACERLLQRFPQLSVRSATRQTLVPMLHEINRIGNVVRSRGWGFVPMTEAELDYSVRQLQRIIDPQTVIGAYLGEQLVGYNVSIPNLNWAIKRCRGTSDWLRYPQLLYWMRKIPEVRLIALGVDPGTRAKGISALVTKSMTDQWHKYQRWEFGWIAEDNLASMDALDRALPLRQYKTWQVYEKGLGP